MHQNYNGLEERLNLLHRSCLEDEMTGMEKLLVFYYALKASNLTELAQSAKNNMIEIGFHNF
jgi:hypothetical protein